MNRSRPTPKRSVSRPFDVAIFVLAGAVVGILCSVLMLGRMPESLLATAGSMTQLGKDEILFACIFFSLIFGALAGFMTFAILGRRTSPIPRMRSHDPQGNQGS